MIRQRLKDMELKITDLADYLQITRPTLYKFIDMYDSNEFDGINRKVLRLFNYIEKNTLAGKKVVINYILTNLVDIKELGDKEEKAIYTKVKKYLIECPESSKAKFIEYIIQKDDFDEIIDYLVEIIPLIKKRKLTEEEIKRLKPYNLLIEALETEEK